MTEGRGGYIGRVKVSRAVDILVEGDDRLEKDTSSKGFLRDKTNSPNPRNKLHFGN